MLKQFGSYISIVRPTVDSVLHLFAFVCALYYAGIRSQSIGPTLWPEIVLILVIYGGCFKYFGMYYMQRLQSLFLIDYNILKASAMAILVYNIACVMLNLPLHAKEIVLFFFIDALYVTTVRMLLVLFLHQMRRKGHNQRFALIVGAGSLGMQLYEKIEERGWTGIKVVGFLDDNLPAGTPVLNSRVLGVTENIREVIRKYMVDHVYICLPMRAFKRIDEIMMIIGEELTNVGIVPDIYQYPLFLKSSVSMLGDIPIITLNDTLFYGWRRAFKRIFDICFASIVLILLSPVFMAIAVAIKLSSPGPVFFKQERVGFNGKKFNMFKFRSMVYSETPETSILTPKNDARVTPVGKILRHASIDELPQFFNVLAGDMSVVGPRPERTWVVNTMKDKVPGYMLKHKMKAGLTGWAQVNGWRGDTSLEHRIEHDLYYIENWSLLFDLKIIFLTLFRGFAHKHAY